MDEFRAARRLPRRPSPLSFRQRSSHRSTPADGVHLIDSIKTTLGHFVGVPWLDAVFFFVRNRFQTQLTVHYSNEKRNGGCAQRLICIHGLANIVTQAKSGSSTLGIAVSCQSDLHTHEV